MPETTEPMDVDTLQGLLQQHGLGNYELRAGRSVVVTDNSSGFWSMRECLVPTEPGSCAPFEHQGWRFGYEALPVKTPYDQR